MNRKLAPALALPVVFLVGGCGGSDTGSGLEAPGLKRCSEVYAEGVVFKTEVDLRVMCDHNGEDVLPATTTTCTDGRTLYWNDEGWGYLEEPFHRYAPGAKRVPPAAEQDACTP